MERHGDLMEAPLLARSTDPVTSHEAAARVHEFAPAQIDVILAELDKWPHGVGAEQLGYGLDIEPYAVRKRLADLHRMGLAAPTGGYRKTISDRRERLWRAT